ncbi:carboxylesterase family protein [Agrobacterium vitis]|nr:MULTISPECIES: carboxylesterase family protein [Rhizobium/Agrobacterium group]MCF1495729.1 carboxylesterase family protein [Allorhizobium ampelinum]MVA45836.1 carboxylesterase family protein [Agrobacterium vitis]
MRAAITSLMIGAVAMIGQGLEARATASSIMQASVTGGKVQGVPSDTPGVAQFLGIPFAGPVGGENRWKPAPPVTPWQGVLAADKWGDQILQDPSKLSSASISDNGLNLVVWTPAQSPDEKLPVYMLIHGGANRVGTNSWRDLYAAQLAAKGVVVVSVQYRLGGQGWLSLPEMAAENPNGPKGNFGVLDLVDALKWIQTNVGAFGGDPAKVTIGGQSAGAENTVALLRTPLAKGLFKRAFIQSSFTGFLPGKVVSYAEKSKQNQEAVNKLFGKETTLKDLRAIDQDTWLAKWKDGKDSLYTAFAGAVGTNQFYTVDDYVFTPDSVNLLQPGDFDGLDIIIGQTADEYTGLRPNDLTMTEEEQHKAMLSAIRPHQVGRVDENVFPLYATNDPTEAYRLSLRMLNDYMFEYVRVGAEIAKVHSKANVYLYYWDHWPPGKDQGFRRAWHGGDPWYFNGAMRAGDKSQLPWTDPDFAMRDMALSYLSNFIKNGDPNGHDVPHWGQVTTPSGSQFIRFHEGQAEMRTSTVFPTRDAYLRSKVLEGLGMTEADIDGEAHRP